MSESSRLAKICTVVNCSRFKIFCVLVGSIFFLLFVMSSLRSSSSLSVEPNSSAVHRKLMVDSSMQNETLEYMSSEGDSSQESDFTYDPTHDVLVFLHMQKTSGSVFGRHLVGNAVGFPSSCYRIRGRKRRNCTASNGYQWLFSRYSTGWACGLHADWTELHACVPRALNRLEGVRRKRRFVNFSMYHTAMIHFIADNHYLSTDLAVYQVPTVRPCMYMMSQKTRLFLRPDNFVTTNDRKACNTSEASEFCLQWNA